MTNANDQRYFKESALEVERIPRKVRPRVFSIALFPVRYMLLCIVLLGLFTSKSHEVSVMTVKADSSYFEYYFTILYPDLVYDVLSARFMFASGVRPEEYLQLTTSNLDLSTNTLNFTQVKGGLYTTRPIDESLISIVFELWRLYGAPYSYYGSYSSLSNYIRRSIQPNFTVSNRLKNLYPFRYSCAAELLRQECTQSDIEEFFNHNNPANTSYYVSQGTAINLQLETT